MQTAGEWYLLLSLSSVVCVCVCVCTLLYVMCKGRCSEVYDASDVWIKGAVVSE